ncbi:cyclase family protein [Marinicella rhabdoformis]|uniref:cyclase family protein n=1 Tax=Marinicella rhabdoformis TaxID=2580566 RepID=UPI0012AEB964|nr:cyclase family protein [Marinicella rhabdoformis]
MKLAVQGFTFDLTKTPESIGITLNFEGPQPNHFGATVAAAQPMQSGSFVGDTRQGGSCNAQDVYLNPHCNGTHTESISHIIDELLAPHEVIKQALVLAQVVTVKPEAGYTGTDRYQPVLENNDKIISKKNLTAVCKSIHTGVKALIIRTLPNDESKQSYQYGDEVQPPFFTNDAMKWLAKSTEIEHLLVDMPSVDRLCDDGLLSNHRLFWNVAAGCHQLKDSQYTHKTITEMAYIPQSIEDGIYLLNLQTPKLKLNAVPSHPVIYHPENN